MTHTIAYRRMLNKMGYYNYQNGLIYRHLHQEGGWDEHLGHCRDYILRAIDLNKPSKITVLGSSWLLELPLLEMVNKHITICLIDIVHPPEVISQTQNLENVELIELDVTGGLIEEVWKQSGSRSFFNKLKSLASLDIPEFIPGSDPGMVISLNLLTQLESLPVEFLRNRSRISSEEFLRFRSEIQRKHIGFLKKHLSVLISDFAEVIIRKDGTEKTINTILTDIPAGRFREEWIWNFDLKGIDYYNSRSVMKVIALTIGTNEQDISTKKVS